MRRSLCDFLRTLPSVEVVGVAADGVQTADVCGAARPDLVLIDFAMPHLNGLEAAQALRQRCPGSRVVIISSFAPFLAVSGPQPNVDAIIDKIDLPRELPAVIDRLFPGIVASAQVILMAETMRRHAPEPNDAAASCATGQAERRKTRDPSP